MNNRTPTKSERNAEIYDAVCAGNEPQHMAPHLGLSTTRVAQIFRNEFERRHPEELKNLEVERITTLKDARLNTIPIGRIISAARQLHKEAACTQTSEPSTAAGE